MASMKDSGIAWIGEIPAEWQIGRISHGYTLTLGKMVESIPTSPNKEKLPYICAANIKWGGLDSSVQKEMYFDKTECRAYAVDEGDLLITEGGSIGTSCIYKGEFGSRCYIQNSVIKACGHDAISNVFLYYWLEFIANSGYLVALCNKATISHYTKDKVSKTPFPLIGKTEETAIVGRLNRLVRPLAQAVSTLETQISTLERYRASVIHEAVTRGLDPTAPTKPSNVDWIGNIPQSWEMTKLKFETSICNGLDYSAEDICDPEDANAVLVVRSSNISNGEMVHADDVYVGSSISASCRLKHDDLVIVRANGSAALVGKSALFTLNETAAAGGFMLICRSSSNPYLRWLLQSDLLSFYRGQFETTTIGRISSTLLGNMLVPWPSAGERKAIAEYLDARTAAIDAVIATRRKQLDILKRRRQSLIYEYVTGKRRVGEEG